MRNFATFLLLLAGPALLAVAEEAINAPIEATCNSTDSVSPFVVNGRDAARNQFPQTVSLQVRGQHICGGSLIDRLWVLTAAHCLEDYRASQVTVFAGHHDRLSGDGVRRQAARLVLHGRYSHTTPTTTGPFLVNDVALIRLQDPMPLSNSVRLASLQSVSTNDGDRVVVAGWGQTSNSDKSQSRMLQFAELAIMSRARCEAAWGRNRITNDQICATDSVRAHCFGDSGGPLFRNGHVVGVVSWGPLTCGAAPGVYASVDWHRQWIRQQTGLNL